MPNRGQLRGKPKDYIARGAFPDGTVKRGAPPAVWWTAEIARRLRAATQDRKVTEVAAEAAISRSTIYDILAGETWPDVVSIVKLQDALNARLWPPWGPRSKP